MKLDTGQFIPRVTDEGAIQLYNYVDSILFRVGRKIPPKDFADLRQEMVLVCLEKLPQYDASKNIPLGGFLYWYCRGAISTWANRHKREIPFDEPLLEWLKERGYENIY